MTPVGDVRMRDGGPRDGLLLQYVRLPVLWRLMEHRGDPGMMLGNNTTTPGFISKHAAPVTLCSPPYTGNIWAPVPGHRLPPSATGQDGERGD
uniref:Uncharacterized protein n=1 Tax=Knipowitschia caucasica TaxID=637954 RepID=A0AAV2MB39_KNICA